jgi:formylglycine-generating enzyme required for sulfatase activity
VIFLTNFPRYIRRTEIPYHYYEKALGAGALGGKLMGADSCCSTSRSRTMMMGHFLQNVTGDGMHYGVSVSHRYDMQAAGRIELHRCHFVASKLRKRGFQLCIIFLIIPVVFTAYAGCITGPFAKRMESNELIDLGKGYCVIGDTRYPLEVRTRKGHIEMVLIKPGEFMMGSPETEEGRVDDEGPRRLVKITKPFYLGKFEVTQAQYHEVMGYDRGHFPGERNPADRVQWREAMVFCQKIGGGCRLPTEAEWEYACRAGTSTPFYFGETISTDQANYYGSAVYGKGRKGIYRGRTTPVGTFSPNAWGLFDMHGNVWEWCEDWYAEDYYRGRPSPDINPRGPAHAFAPPGQRFLAVAKVVRGGSWLNPPRALRSAARSTTWYTAWEVDVCNFGVRIAWSPE